jgi:hypothetical protein
MVGLAVVAVLLTDFAPAEETDASSSAPAARAAAATRAFRLVVLMTGMRPLSEV